jgi:Ketosteroid isomerase-related protein
METATQTKNNVEVVQQAFADFGSGNVQSILNVCTDDVMWTGADNPDVPFAGTFKGKQGVKEFFTKIAENVDFTSFEPKEFFKDGNVVIVLGHNTGKVKKTGKTFDNDWCFVFRFRDGKMYHYYAYVDTLNQAEAFK